MLRLGFWINFSGGSGTSLDTVLLENTTLFKVSKPTIHQECPDHMILDLRDILPKIYNRTGKYIFCCR